MGTDCISIPCWLYSKTKIRTSRFPRASKTLTVGFMYRNKSLPSHFITGWVTKTLANLRILFIPNSCKCSGLCCSFHWAQTSQGYGEAGATFGMAHAPLLSPHVPYPTCKMSREPLLSFQWATHSPTTPRSVSTASTWAVSCPAPSLLVTDSRSRWRIQLRLMTRGQVPTLGPVLNN